MRYIQRNMQDDVRFKLLLINLLTFFARQTTNTLDDEMVAVLAGHIVQNPVIRNKF